MALSEAQREALETVLDVALKRRPHPRSKMMLAASEVSEMIKPSPPKPTVPTGSDDNGEAEDSTESS